MIVAKRHHRSDSEDRAWGYRFRRWRMELQTLDLVGQGELKKAPWLCHYHCQGYGPPPKRQDRRHHYNIETLSEGVLILLGKPTSYPHFPDRKNPSKTRDPRFVGIGCLILVLGHNE